ncbi:MAG: signal peptidase II [Lachnospiraceae bacterium]|nr:signal peptidase II [Lachnospiraceae bacterium]
MKSRMRFLIFFLVSTVLLCAVDAFTKQLAVRLLQGRDDVVLIPGALQLHYLENTGAAFGILRGQMWIFCVLTVVVCFGIVSVLLRLPLERRFMPLAAVLIFLLAGAFGNFADRIRLHYVVDFIYFSLINFPVFNIADIYVTCSVFVLILLLLFYYSEEDLERVTGKRK